MKDSYSIVKHGLFEKHDLEYAKALKELSPQKAASDLLEYLSMSPVEELRQLNLETTNVLVCYEALEHLKNYAINVSNPNFASLFYYAISRNHLLASMLKSSHLRLHL